MNRPSKTLIATAKVAHAIAELVAEEREFCALIAESWGPYDRSPDKVSAIIAAEIRARGEK